MKESSYFIKYIHLVICIFLIFGHKNAKGQDLFFSQYLNTPLYTNPAFAGHEAGTALTLANRRQWVGLAPYITYQANAILPLYHKKYTQTHFGGAGLSITQDKSGQGLFLQTFMAQATGAYNLYFSQDQAHRLSFGLSAGIMQRSTDPEAMQWGSQYAPTLPSGHNPGLASGENINQPTRLMADVGTGLLWYYNPQKNYLLKSYSWYAGLAATHLNMPNQSPIRGLLQTMPILWKGSAGFEWSFYKNLVFNPNVLILYQNGASQYNMGGYMGYAIYNSYQTSKNKIFERTQLQAGAWYRAGDALIYMVGLKSNYFSLSFSYDMTSSSLANYTNTGGSYEFCLGLYLPHKPKPKRFSSPLY